jgi:hypothetical protein
MLQSGDKSSSRNSVSEYWTLLSDDDKWHYHQLRKRIDPLSVRTARDQLPMKFQVVLNEIQRYSIHHNSDDWKRCIACGIVWLDDALAISTRQLRKLLGKCKSSINTGFQSLGYSLCPMSSDHVSQLTEFLPCLPQNGRDFRQWTIRTISKAELTSCMGRLGVRELTQGVTPASFDLTSQVLCEQEAMSLEMDHDILMQSDSEVSDALFFLN